ncbi:hypothetical protein [Chromobacterium rhizoryzae]|uniref:hypothetical protein n=1 Tax=Chromobacterium rhizoryzae TaxID=1778675 RepID=UPI001D05E00D|nr:hypothetical protein [Chromobacterium rhizoryzae]
MKKHRLGGAFFMAASAAVQNAPRVVSRRTVSATCCVCILRFLSRIWPVKMAKKDIFLDWGYYCLIVIIFPVGCDDYGIAQLGRLAASKRLSGQK